MDDVTAAFAKLAGTLKAVRALLTKNPRTVVNRPFSIADVSSYFHTASREMDVLRRELPKLFGDFEKVETEPTVKMSDGSNQYPRSHVERLERALEQAIELRSHSELERPTKEVPRRVFISHGRATYWYAVQNYVEKDLKIDTLELAQQPNEGRTVLQKLQEESDKCSFAVIVMSGDDRDADGVARARENVVHEIGWFQAKYGLSGVALLHEEGTNIPTNIAGVVYVPFPRDHVEATFGVLLRELQAFFKKN
jgi:predicted nucleotide-binding protein